MRHYNKRCRLLIRSVFGACALLLIAAAVVCAVPAVQKLLPAKDAVKGWSVLAGSLEYGKGKDLTKIYDGGYELYTDNGVIDAVRQMYQRKSDYVEVTIHTMKSDKVALNFLKYWQKQNKIKTLSRSKVSSYFVTTNPNTAVYFVTGRYFTTVNAFHATERAKKDVAAFMGVIESNVSNR